MRIGYPLNHLGSIWYHLEPLEVLFSLNQFLGWDFICRFLQQQDGSNIIAGRKACQIEEKFRNTFEKQKEYV